MIAGTRELCPECREIYGDRADYPEWLKFLLADMRREQRLEVRESVMAERSIDDDTPKPRRASLAERLDENNEIILRGTFPTDGTPGEWNRVR